MADVEEEGSHDLLVVALVAQGEEAHHLGGAAEAAAVRDAAPGEAAGELAGREQGRDLGIAQPMVAEQRARGAGEGGETVGVGEQLVGEADGVVLGAAAGEDQAEQVGVREVAEMAVGVLERRRGGAVVAGGAAVAAAIGIRVLRLVELAD